MKFLTLKYWLRRECSLHVQYTQPVLPKNFGFKYGDFPKSERYYEEAISLPIFPKLTDETGLHD